MTTINEFFEHNTTPTVEEFKKKFGHLEMKNIHFRLDDRVEWICEHGIGHTIFDVANQPRIHGCDGCCSKLEKRK